MITIFLIPEAQTDDRLPDDRTERPSLCSTLRAGRRALCGSVILPEEHLTTINIDSDMNGKRNSQSTVASDDFNIYAL